MRVSPKIIVLLVLHVLVLSGLYAIRYPINEAIERRAQWDGGHREGTLWEDLRLYMSLVLDEAYYYEWSTVVLGKPFESGYPFAARAKSGVSDYFDSVPKPHFPYRDIGFEYPPLLIPVILGVRSISGNYQSFARWLAFVLMTAYLMALWLAYGIWKHRVPEHRLSWSTLLWISLLSVLFIGQVYVTRLDVIPSLLSVAALAAFLKRQYTASAVWVVMGFFAKAYAILLAPLFGIILLHQKKYRELGVATVTVVCLLIVGNGMMAWMTHGAYWDSFRYHAGRGIQLESLYALIPLLSHLIAATPIRVFTSRGAQEIAMAHMTWLLMLTNIVPLCLFTLVYMKTWRHLGKLRTSESVNSLVVRSSVLIIMAFIIGFRVLSPQFLIWLTPVLFLSVSSHYKLFFGLWFFICLLTQMIFPAFYWMLEAATVPGITLLLLRNGGLVVLFIWLLLTQNQCSHSETL